MTAIVMKIMVKTTKGRKVLYWASTILASLSLATSGSADLVGIPDVAEGIERLGYPVYFPIILGMWKLLGSTAIIVQGLPRLKEWAYAGIFFTLTGAAISHAVTGDPLGNILVTLALLVVVMTSWVLQPARGSAHRMAAMTQRAAAELVVVDTGGVDETAGSLFHDSRW